jgi:hypothetical protein
LCLEKILYGACSRPCEYKKANIDGPRKKERRQFRHEVKKSINLKETDTIESVVSRVVTAQIFDSEDFEMQVDRWLSSADTVFLFIYFVEESPY